MLLSARGVKISVLTTAYDLGESEPLEGITTGRAVAHPEANVRYLTAAELKYGSIKKLVANSDVRNIYVNGMYSLPFVIYPWLVWKAGLQGRVKFIVSPRGMLQEGALKVKSFKKKLFINMLRSARLQKNITWHATDAQESEDIKNIFGRESKVVIAPNVPKQPLDTPALITKQSGALNLVYLSLISEKKNLHLALQILKETNLPVVFDIYGPVKDAAYWAQCQSVIKEMEGSNIRVAYKGDVTPDKVQATLSRYHALFLPTKGENFGHAIYEALSVGRPVIITTETPWKGLQAKKAGFDISLQNMQAFKTAIDELYMADEVAYANWVNGAHKQALAYWQENDFWAAYKPLFD